MFNLYHAINLIGSPNEFLSKLKNNRMLKKKKLKKKKKKSPKKLIVLQMNLKESLKKSKIRLLKKLNQMFQPPKMKKLIG